MNKSWLLIALAVGLLVTSVFLSPESNSHGKILEATGLLTSISNIEFTGTNFIFEMDGSLDITVKVKNENEMGNCRVVVKDMDGKVIDKVSVWIESGKSRDINCTIKYPDYMSSLGYYELELYSMQEKVWVKTDETLLKNIEIKDIVNGKEK